MSKEYSFYTHPSRAVFDKLFATMYFDFESSRGQLISEMWSKRVGSNRESLSNTSGGHMMTDVLILAAQALEENPHE